MPTLLSTVQNFSNASASRFITLFDEHLIHLSIYRDCGSKQYCTHGLPKFPLIFIIFNGPIVYSHFTQMLTEKDPKLQFLEFISDHHTTNGVSSRLGPDVMHAFQFQFLQSIETYIFEGEGIITTIIS